MAAGQDAAAYEQELEKRVKEILRGVSGVGEVDVMIVLKSSAEKVIQVDNSTSKSVTTEKGERNKTGPWKAWTRNTARY